MTAEWGKISSKDDIQQTIVNCLTNEHSIVQNFSFSHIRSGFTDNVFQVEVSLSGGSSRTFIAKEYLKEWHQKERRVYETILQPNIFLGAPQLIGSGNGFIVLEYLNPERCIPISSRDIDLLQRWLVVKHNFFKQHPEFTSPFIEDEQIQIRYLIEKPLGLLAQLDCPELTSLIQRVLGLERHFIDIVRLNNSLPISLEHGDLEPQNLFVENSETLRVVDWVNTRRGSSLFDINQFFETARDLGANVDIEEKTKEIADAIELRNLGNLLLKIREIMLLNKIHFYGNKYLKGELFSHSRAQPTYSMLKGYLIELNALLEN